MESVQVPFTRETVAITASPPRVGIIRCMAGRTIGSQRPVGDPHFRVGRIGKSHPAGGAIPVCPIASIMQIVHGIPRTAVHVMASRSAATALVALPQGVDTARMATDAVAAAGRETRLQVRDGRVTEVAVAAMGDVDRFIG